MELMATVLPPHRVIHSKAILQVGYDFSDAIGKGFGSTIQLNDKIIWRAGQWVEFYEKEASSWLELENIVIALEGYAREHADSAVELFMFTERL
jgi:hypothetical protein